MLVTDQRLDQQTDTRDLTTYLTSESNQQTGTRDLTTYLTSESNQQTGFLCQSGD
jgi:hypothetical protein